MIDPNTGVFRGPYGVTFEEAISMAEPNEVVVAGGDDLEEKLQAMSRRIQLGEKEQQKRKARRQQQKASRKHNR